VDRYGAFSGEGPAFPGAVWSCSFRFSFMLVIALAFFIALARAYSEEKKR
jgi:hypothetical protein